MNFKLFIKPYTIEELQYLELTACAISSQSQIQLSVSSIKQMTGELFWAACAQPHRIHSHLIISNRLHCSENNILYAHVLHAWWASAASVYENMAKPPLSTPWDKHISYNSAADRSVLPHAQARGRWNKKPRTLTPENDFLSCQWNEAGRHMYSDRSPSIICWTYVWYSGSTSRRLARGPYRLLADLYRLSMDSALLERFASKAQIL